MFTVTGQKEFVVAWFVVEIGSNVNQHYNFDNSTNGKIKIDGLIIKI